MDGNHPITPPEGLVREWECDLYDRDVPFDTVIREAYRAGADWELEACIAWMAARYGEESHAIGLLRSARRPEPPSLKELALKELRQLPIDPELGVCASALDTIRRALEQLND